MGSALLKDRDDGIADGRKHFRLERSDHGRNQGFVGSEDFTWTDIADVPQCSC
jgi:hypothetical protein